MTNLSFVDVRGKALQQECQQEQHAWCRSAWHLQEVQRVVVDAQVARGEHQVARAIRLLGHLWGNVGVLHNAELTSDVGEHSNLRHLCSARINKTLQRNNSSVYLEQHGAH